MLEIKLDDRELCYITGLMNRRYNAIMNDLGKQLIQLPGEDYIEEYVFLEELAKKIYPCYSKEFQKKLDEMPSDIEMHQL